MSGKEVVETIYGKSSKYESLKDTGGLLSGTATFYIRKDGEPWKSFSNVSAAVKVARDAR